MPGIGGALMSVHTLFLGYYGKEVVLPEMHHQVRSRTISHELFDRRSL
jgi:hypothetical protein